MVGLVVIPTTWRLATRSARLPVSILSRDRSSSQIETPAAESWARGSPWEACDITVPSDREWAGWPGDWATPSGGRGPDAVLGGADDRRRGEPELLEELGVLGAGAVVLDRHAAAGVADQPLPAHRDARLDAHARLDLWGKDAVAIALVLGVEPLTARHGDDPGLHALG